MSHSKKGLSSRGAARRPIPGEIVIIVVLILVVGVAAGLWYFVLQPSLASGQGELPAAAAPAISADAPNFAAADLTGSAVRLSDYRGKPVVLNAWATWCGPCRSEMPDLEKFYQEYKDQGVVVLAVNMGESKTQVTGFVKENGYTFPVLLDESTAAVGGPYRISGIPTTFFITREGKIAGIKVGAMSLAEMKRRVAAIL